MARLLLKEVLLTPKSTIDIAMKSIKLYDASEDGMKETIRTLWKANASLSTLKSHTDILSIRWLETEEGGSKFTVVRSNDIAKAAIMVLIRQIVITFANAAQANEAIAHGMQWDGLSHECVKFVAPHAVERCLNCLDFGHDSLQCTTGPRCIFCFGGHKAEVYCGLTARCAFCGQRHRQKCTMCEPMRFSMQVAQRVARSQEQLWKTSAGPNTTASSKHGAGDVQALSNAGQASTIRSDSTTSSEFGIGSAQRPSDASQVNLNSEGAPRKHHRWTPTSRKPLSTGDPTAQVSRDQNYNEVVDLSANLGSVTINNIPKPSPVATMPPPTLTTSKKRKMAETSEDEDPEEPQRERKRLKKEKKAIEAQKAIEKQKAQKTKDKEEKKKDEEKKKQKKIEGHLRAKRRIEEREEKKRREQEERQAKDEEEAQEELRAQKAKEMKAKKERREKQAREEEQRVREEEHRARKHRKSKEQREKEHKLKKAKS